MRVQVAAIALAALLACSINQSPRGAFNAKAVNPPVSGVWRGPSNADIRQYELAVGPLVFNSGEMVDINYIIDSPAGYSVTACDYFVGVGRGNIFEGHTVVYDSRNRVVCRISPHKEVDHAYYDGYFPTDDSGALPIFDPGPLNVNVVAYPTTSAAIFWHTTLTVTFKKGSGVPTPIPTPTPAPTPTPTPTPTPPPTTCEIPRSNDPAWESGTTDLPTVFQVQMDQAIQAYEAKYGNPCGTAEGLVQERLGEELQILGLCASKWDVELDVIIRDNGTPGRWEDWDPTAANGCWRNSGHGFYIGDYTYGGEVPPDPQCGAPFPPDISYMKVKLQTNNPKITLDVTPLVSDAAYCAAIGFTDGRANCPVRPEGHPERQTCEAIKVGTPQWSANKAAWSVRPNPYLYRCTSLPQSDCVGATATVCTETQPKVCGEFTVTAEALAAQLKALGYVGP